MLGMLLMAGWMSGAISFAFGWTARARLHVRVADLPRVRGRLTHGGARRRSLTVRCRHVRRGVRRVRPLPIHDQPAAR
jgi:hypothetical protein